MHTEASSQKTDLIGCLIWDATYLSELLYTGQMFVFLSSVFIKPLRLAIYGTYYLVLGLGTSCNSYCDRIVVVLNYREGKWVGVSSVQGFNQPVS